MEIENSKAGLSCELLKKEHAAQGQELSREAGWNQTVMDWELMITHGEGYGLFTAERRLVGTVLMLPFGEEYRWISMVLVHSSWRRRGLASRLMTLVLDELKKNKRGAVLDATEAGEKVYSQLGFHCFARYARLRWDRESPEKLILSRGMQAPGSTVRKVRSADMAAVLDWDSRLSGKHRSFILNYEYACWPEAAKVAEDADGSLRGYIFGRVGLNARELGPIVATCESVAEELYRRVMKEIDGPLYMDVARRCPEFLERRLREGWVVERGFARMATGSRDWCGQFAKLYASAGPDFG